MDSLINFHLLKIPTASSSSFHKKIHVNLFMHNEQYNIILNDNFNTFIYCLLQLGIYNQVFNSFKNFVNIL